MRGLAGINDNARAFFDAVSEDRKDRVVLSCDAVLEVKLHSDWGARPEEEAEPECAERVGAAPVGS